MSELPLWPPVVALLIGGLGYGYVMWLSKRFDRKYPKRSFEE